MSLRLPDNSEAFRSPLQRGARGELPREPGLLEAGTSRIDVGGESLEYDDLRDIRHSMEPFPNLAGNAEVAARARETVLQQRRHYEQAMAEVFPKWELHRKVWRDTNFGSLASIEGRIPTFYATLQRMKSRVNAPWEDDAIGFSVRGIDKNDKRAMQKLREYLAFQMRQNRMDELDSEIDIPALLYGIAATKVWWAYETKSVIERKPTGKINIATGEQSFRYEEKNIVSYEGWRAGLVNMWSFFIDPYCSNPNHPDPYRRARYVGDESIVIFEDLLERQRQGQIMNVADVRRSSGSRSSSLKSPGDSQWNDTLLDSSPGSARTHRLTECWTLFSAREGEVAKEYVIELVDDDTVVRVQRNPNRFGHRPYAVWKANMDPFEIAGMTPMDHVASLQGQIDQLWREFVVTTQKNGSPPLIVRPGSRLAKNIGRLDPGAIIFGEPNDMKPLPPSGNAMDLLRGIDVAQRAIEEATGAYVMPGDAQGDTATAIEAKTKSANERIRKLQNGKADYKRQLLELVHGLNRQYCREEQTFRVLGRDAASIPGYSQTQTIKPEELDVNVDFEFDGMRHQRTTGLEERSIRAYFDILMAAAQIDPNVLARVDVGKLLEHGSRGMLGYSANDPVIRPSPEDMILIPQHMEISLAMQGKEIVVQDGDDHEEHLAVCEAWLNDVDPMKTPGDSHMRIMEHAAQHAIAASVQGHNTPPDPMQQMPEMGAPGQGTPGQVPDNAMLQQPIAAQSPQGVTPGPNNMDRQRKIGRKVTPSQT